MRERRPKHRDLEPEAKARANARATANVYQRRGHLTREPCQACGSMEAEKHHPDYRHPLVVEWLCRECHLTEHHKAA